MTLKLFAKGNRQTLWRSRAHQAWFRLCAVCLSLYISYIVYLSQSPIFESTAQTALALCVFAALSAAVCFGLCFACERLQDRAPKAGPVRSKMDLRVFLAAFIIALAVFGCTFASCYPGGVNYDVSNQWHQVHSGEFNNWHPLFHTLLVWLVTRIVDSYSFGLLVQIVLFAAMLARLTATLHKRGVPAWLVLAVHTAVAASLPVRNTLMYLGKDSAMTLGIIALTTQAVEILYTRGQWLKKPTHAISMGLWLAFATLLRINALLWTVPLLLCVFFAYKPVRKQAALALGVMIALMAIIQGPVYGMLDVVYPDNTVEESVGLPMTILGDIRQREPDKLDEETIAFLRTLAPDEAWQNIYSLHNYNSIKFTYEREWIKYTPVTDILSMSVRAAMAAPRTAFEAFNGLTDLVWGVDGQNEGFGYVRNSGDIESVRYGSAKLNALGTMACKGIEWIMNLQPLRYLTCNIGVQLLLLLLATLRALRRHGCEVLMLAVPTLLYNLGTMFLLCGNDARFFQFAMTVSLPAILALLFLPKQEEA